MADLKNPRLIYAKGFLFLLGGGMASGLLLWEAPTLRVALLLGVAVWCFARFYYFAFYVIEHYVDPGYRFAGLGDFVRYLLSRRPRTGRARVGEGARPAAGVAPGSGHPPSEKDAGAGEGATVRRE
ncbi:hypothetical protein LZ198_22230 [Myxococcus sp. K15C18031901]|uniref:hypothetical protein n=1 Tax=Myxococcus dinghuensis TaxID=2906761 RepID=UPI0020A79080|nr:hypothetical protein [Myxococcus dinghuensis]MCP3101598.1 hypothetical protein [Myxococcus dinghuensis]